MGGSREGPIHFCRVKPALGRKGGRVEDRIIGRQHVTRCGVAVAAKRHGTIRASGQRTWLRRMDEGCAGSTCVITIDVGSRAADVDRHVGEGHDGRFIQPPVGGGIEGQHGVGCPNRLRAGGWYGGRAAPDGAWVVFVGSSATNMALLAELSPSPSLPFQRVKDAWKQRALAEHQGLVNESPPIFQNDTCTWMHLHDTYKQHFVRR